MNFLRENRLLIIGLLISGILHASVFGLLSFLNKKEEKKEKEKPVYISILQKPEEKKKTSIKRKIPKPSKKQLQKTLKKKSKKILKKHKKKKTVKKKIKKKNKKRKIKITKKPVKHKVKQKPVKKAEKTEEPKEKLKKENLQKNKKVAKNTIPEIKKAQEKNRKEFSLLNLKGKDSLFETGEKTVKEKKKVSEEDIYAYIRALERYLNSLARRKDLYPPMAKRLRLEGSLTVRFTIRKDGSVDENSIKVMVSSGYSILDKGAIKLIKKYVPLFAKQEGKKPPRDRLTIELPITFEIIGW